MQHLLAVRGHLLDDRVGVLAFHHRAGRTFAFEVAEIALIRVVGHHQVVAVLHDQKVVAAGMLSGQIADQGGGIDPIEAGVQDHRGFGAVGAALGKRQAAVGIAPEVARVHVWSHHPARHAVVVDDRQEGDGGIGPAHTGSHQQEAIGHRLRVRLDDDVREVGRDAVHDVGCGPLPVVNPDGDVVVAVHGDRPLHGSGRGAAVVQQTQGSVLRLRLGGHLQRRAVRATHRVVQHTGIEGRVHPFAPAHLQRTQPRGGHRSGGARPLTTAEDQRNGYGTQGREMIAPDGAATVSQRIRLHCEQHRPQSRQILERRSTIVNPTNGAS